MTAIRTRADFIQADSFDTTPSAVPQAQPEGAGRLIEYGVYAIDLACRRWKIAVLPLLVAALVAWVAVMVAPTRYTAKSVILLQAPNRGTAWVPPHQRQSTIEQVSALEAWIKSDHILRSLLPALFDIGPNTSAEDIETLKMVVRRTLTFELVGASALEARTELRNPSVLEVRLEGSSPVGLGRRLETIVARLMEGVTVPDQGILSAPQFVVLRRGDAAATAERTVSEAIARAGLGAPEVVMSRLRRLHELEEQRSARLRQQYEPRAQTRVAAPAVATDASRSGIEALDQQIREIRDAISSDANLVAGLLALYADYHRAMVGYEQLRARLPGDGANYIRIFESADSLLVIGRPQDPTTGESAAKKVAIGFLLLGFVTSAGLVLLLELLGGQLRLRSRFESVSGLPVIARFSGLEPRRR